MTTPLAGDLSGRGESPPTCACCSVVQLVQTAPGNDIGSVNPLPIFAISADADDATPSRAQAAMAAVVTRRVKRRVILCIFTGAQRPKPGHGYPVPVASKRQIFVRDVP